MADSFGSMVGALRLYVPDLPLTLAEHFIRDRYRRLAERRPWAGLRRESEFLVNAAKTAGTVTVTNNSTSIVGAGSAFAASDVGRQFKIGIGSPIYTVATVTDPTHLTLDRVWGGVTAGTQTYKVWDGYVTVPTDFMRFIAVTDPLRGWRLRHWITQDELIRWDPQRTFTGDPYALIDRRFSASGVPQYELWPYCLTQRGLPYYYIARPADLVDDDDEPFYPMRGDVIVSGALADLCRWPGTPDAKNPMFNLQNMTLFRTFEAEFEDKLVELERADEDVYMTWYANNSWAEWPFAPMSAAYIQSHAV